MPTKGLILSVLELPISSSTDKINYYRDWQSTLLKGIDQKKKRTNNMDYVEIKCDQCETTLRSISSELDDILNLMIDKRSIYAAIRVDKLNTHLKNLIKNRKN